MLGVIYARYSSDNQRDESIDGQLRVCKEYAERNGIQIVGEYIDRAISGRKDNRPEFQRMIRDSKKKLFDVVLVWKFDRFSRSRFDAAIYKKKLQENGVRVVSVTEYIPDSPYAPAIEAIIEADAEIYVRNLSENVIRGMTENALKAMYNGSTLPVGFKIDKSQHYEIDPLTAPYVVDAYQMYADGKTMTEIAEYLNEKGVRTIRNSKITVNVISRMLRNRKYLGEYRYADIVISDAIPQIVPIELFDRIQRRIERTRKAPAQHKAEDDYILTTKLFCGKCKAMMVGESGTSHSNKEVHHYYKCVSVKRHRGCDKKTVRKDWIEDLVVEQIQKVLLDYDLLDRIADAMEKRWKSEDTTVELLQKTLASTEKALKNLVRAIEQGIFSASTKERLDELEASKADTLEKIVKAELESQKAVLNKDIFLGWLQQFKELDITRKEDRQRLVDHFVNVIYLYDDHFDLFFNFRDGVDTVTFDEIQLAKSKERKKRSSLSESSDIKNFPVPKIDNFRQKVVDFLSKPQAWYIITRQRVYHQRRRAAFVYHHGVSHAYLSCGLDEIQSLRD